MRTFLASIPLRGTSIVVIGSGDAAAAKARLFEGSESRFQWFAGPEAGRADAWVERWPQARDLTGAKLVFIAVSDRADAAVLADLARASGALVNVVDQPDLSDFNTPALIDRGGVVVGIATGGVAPVLAREIRARVESALPARLDSLARLAEGLRATVVAAIPDFTGRRRFWEAAFRGAPRDLALEGRTSQARREMLRLLNRSEPAQGVVHLVGAGPGDPELLTLKALRALEDADVVIHDRLVSTAVLDRARRDARRIFVGKKRGEHAVRQEEIAGLMIAEARAGHRVVRLKGGDPFVFGRGGEELQAVREAGVDVIVVPGVTAALACAAAAGIPLTHRTEAQAVTFVTAETKPGGVGPDWRGLSASNHTLAIYMGVAGAPSVQASLLDGGREPDTPIAVIENGSRPDQRVLTGTLGGLARLIGREKIVSPALLIVGEVAAWAQSQAGLRSEAQEAAA